MTHEIGEILAARAERAERAAAKQAAANVKRVRPKATTQVDEGQTAKKRGHRRGSSALAHGGFNTQGAEESEPLAEVVLTDRVLIDPMLETWRAP
jgi:hypothetical protein